MRNQWGHWYLYDGTLGPDGQMEQVRDALLTEIELKAAEGISVDVLQAGTWDALMTLVWRDEGDEGLKAFLKEIGLVQH